jgi:hypothetical protein
VEGLTGATRNSHRLLAWAAGAHGAEAQGRLAEELFKAGPGQGGPLSI